MKICSVYDAEFARYGRVHSGIESAALLREMEKIPLPESGTAYEPSIAALEACEAFADYRTSVFGGMPVQLGMCWGRNTKLNCLEYHRDSEINLGLGDFILLLAKQDEIEDLAKIRSGAEKGATAVQKSSVGKPSGVAGLGPDGKVLEEQLPEQEVDAFTKEETLKDTTAALYGLPNTAVPDDAFNKLSASVLHSITQGKTTLTDINNVPLQIPNSQILGGVQIETGSYVGTGKYGYSNPNSLTFGFEPKLVFMFEDKFPVYKSINSQTSQPVYGTTIGMTTEYSRSLFNIYGRRSGDDYYLYAKKSSDGKTLSWYHEAGVDDQMNDSGVTFNYIAIG